MSFCEMPLKSLPFLSIGLIVLPPTPQSTFNRLLVCLHYYISQSFPGKQDQYVIFIYIYMYFRNCGGWQV